MSNKRLPQNHPLFEYEYEDEITFECPIRGIVTQKVMVKHYKSKYQAAQDLLVKNSSEVDSLLDDGELTIHSEDDLGTDE